MNELSGHSVGPDRTGLIETHVVRQAGRQVGGQYRGRALTSGPPCRQRAQRLSAIAAAADRFEKAVFMQLTTFCLLEREKTSAAPSLPLLRISLSYRSFQSSSRRKFGVKDGDGLMAGEEEEGSSSASPPRTVFPSHPNYARANSEPFKGE